jgi:SAM domain (Sterile alpha motif)
MTRFGTWLAEIGVGSYDAVFASNDIDFDVIRLLNDAELRELGLTLGDRKRLLQAVARLDGQRAEGTLTAAVARRRTPPDHRDVLRPGGLDGAE